MATRTAAPHTSVPPAKRPRANERDDDDDDEFAELDGLESELLQATQECEAARGRGGVAAACASVVSKGTAASSPPSSDVVRPVRNATSARVDGAFGAAPCTIPYAGTSEDPHALERATMDRAWFDRLLPAMKLESFAKLKQFLYSEQRAGRTIYPPPHLIHSWSRTTPLDRVKVVIVGQDPYHQPGQACGHSFSVPHGKAVPASLQNIYKELRAEFPTFVPPKHGCLDGWANQGVLLLNACLTVSAGAAGSHHNRGWEPFTREILRAVANAAGREKSGSGRPLAALLASQGTPRDGVPSTAEPSGPSRGVVFLAWGVPAARTLADAGITEKTPNVCLLRSPHPSPLSAHRGFLGNGHFAKANAWLEDPRRHGVGGGIRWEEL
ncbi:uracil-DNA glycosylase [Malassezia sp. CBS 17886]|nr:uracil-DNA glycosylase [Malassezia sp. CBS 17886]